MELIKLKYSEIDIVKKRAFVAEKLITASKCIKNGTIKEITVTDLKLLFEFYDECFLMDGSKITIMESLAFPFLDA